MLSRLGLRSRMAVSYVLVSAAAVLVVEAVLLAVMVPRVLSAKDGVEQAQQRAIQAEIDAARSKAGYQALETAAVVGAEASRVAAQEPGRSNETLLAAASAEGFREALQPRPEDSDTPETLLTLATVDGRVIASNSAGVLARNQTLPDAAIGTSARSGRTDVDGQAAVWATSPVQMTDEVGANRLVIGIAYVRLQVPSDGAAKDGRFPGGEAPAAADTAIGSLIVTGVVILALLLPVGALFGLLSTGRLIRRIRRLAQGASAMADGDLKARIPLSGRDEVGHLEQAFNSMAERLEAAVQVQRTVAGTEARRAERTRIARELHDSISQDLFSASLLAGGLRKALPADSDLRRQVEAMEVSLARTMREMRAMLLELRPIALEDAGLAEALDELCRTYEARLGISISSRIDPLRLDAPVEHAVLRVVQEALGNAVRHGEPHAIELRVAETDGQVAVTIQDDGHGFDPSKAAERHGMGLALMRERVSELGGTVEILSAPERGATVKVSLPGGSE